MTRVYTEKKDCTGCGLCGFACPKKAIGMQPDEEGFCYPQIDAALCVDCGLCQRICPNHPGKRGKEPYSLRAFAAKHDDGIRRFSSSGGMFTALSDEVLLQGGVVFGARLLESGTVRHTVAATAAERDLMRDSKYVQSDITSCYGPVKQALSKGKPVLFVGTPCQTAAVRKAFEKEKGASGLLLCDLVCHGVPSPLVFSAYLQRLSKELDGDIRSLAFRSKKAGWSCKAVTVETNRKKEPSYLLDDRYFRLYFAGLITRPCCHSCIYTNLHRAGDITIGDCWGDSVRELKLYDDLGLSLVLVNTENGWDWFQRIKDRISSQEIDVSGFMQEQLQRPSGIGEQRAVFWKDFHSKPFKSVLQKYTLTGFTGKMRRASGALGRLLKK